MSRLQTEPTRRTTRDRLLGAARELTEEGGFANASVVAIARRANLATGTLYRHFSSKGELFVELIRETGGRELQEMQEVNAKTKSRDPAERLSAVVGTFAQRALRNPRLAWAVIAEPVDPLVDAERIAYRANLTRLLAAGLQAAIDQGKLPDQDAELTAAALVGGVGEALVGPLSPVASGSASDEETVEAIRAFARRAVGFKSG